ncbi:hypothetical protein NBZ79_03605 [Sneathiella marina]|uniref:Lipoprotein n=1 Tax=Sneathiella marina TaxID=2950108 RepID=A0ABY4W4U4_9PROT|nr:hypothetical protein [Sneathiella marina]USG62058.1 hypothetical protein NBZ79_03605 [Sneathiella marina]
MSRFNQHLKNLSKLGVLLAFGVLLSACAVGNKYDYKNQPIDLAASSDQKIGVSVVDQRIYIVSGEKTPDFVGLQRGGFGNPFDVSTKAGGPMADSFAFAIADGLKSRGIDAGVVIASPTSNRSEARGQVIAGDFSKYLIVYLSEWKSDTLVNVKFIYDVTAEVLDKNGGVLAVNKLDNTEVLGGDFGNPPAFAKENIPIAFQRVMKDLISDPAILDALK